MVIGYGDEWPTVIVGGGDRRSSILLVFTEYCNGLTGNPLLYLTPTRSHLIILSVILKILTVYTRKKVRWQCITTFGNDTRNFNDEYQCTTWGYRIKGSHRLVLAWSNKVWKTCRQNPPSCNLNLLDVQSGPKGIGWTHWNPFRKVLRPDVDVDVFHFPTQSIRLHGSQDFPKLSKERLSGEIFRQVNNS